MYWPKKSSGALRREVFDALSRNLSYSRGEMIGFPGSFLDRRVFPDAAFLRETPYLSVLRENPNHIGCHTVAQAELGFEGTQMLEVDLLRLCAEEIMGAEPGGYDGYVCSGGTECNVEALWIQRNSLCRSKHVARSGMAIIHSTDTHYSVDKASDLLGVATVPIEVDPWTRQMLPTALRTRVIAARAAGVTHFTVVLNLGTTMFGSIDDPLMVTDVLDSLGVDYRIHVDAAFGGFIYPFTGTSNRLDFREPRIDSITMDGHKMLQAPYGTGVFLVRKGLIENVCTEEARYVHGKDYTLCGSRSGASAVALWMILHAYGSDGAREFLLELIARTERFCERLSAMGVRFFRAPAMNVVAILAEDLPAELAAKYMLVPDTHDRAPTWWKAVVMDHVESATLDRFADELAAARRVR